MEGRKQGHQGSGIGPTEKGVLCSKGVPTVVIDLEEDQELNEMLDALTINNQVKSVVDMDNDQDMKTKQPGANHGLTNEDMKITEETKVAYDSIIKESDSKRYSSEPLTLYQFRDIKAIFKHKSKFTTEVSRTNPKDILKYSSFYTLKEKHWINDQVINTYIAMMTPLAETSEYKIMNSYFTVLLSKDSKTPKLVAKFGLTKESRLIVPIHSNGNHWFFVAIEKGVIRIYDSLANHGVPSTLEDFCRGLYGVAEKVCMEFPKQAGDRDCGVFMLNGIKSVIGGSKKWRFSQETMKYDRLILARDILAGVITKFDV